MPDRAACHTVAMSSSIPGSTPPREATSDPGPDPSAALSHFDERGRAQMVDVGAKPETHRVAIASGEIRMDPATRDLVREGRAAKGDVLGVAQVAAIMGAKRTADLVPMCHPLMLTRVTVDFHLDEAPPGADGRVAIGITARVETRGPTGVEMEALTAVSVAGLTIYDMVKAVDRGMVIGAIQVEAKQGGRSGDWRRGQPAAPAAPSAASDAT